MLPTMTLSRRIQLARRRVGFSQAALALAVGVQRSAVSHWESERPVRPSAQRLEAIATTTLVHYEWLATGRGPMALSEDLRLDSIAAVDGLLVDDPLELRLLRAFRVSPAKSRVILVELSEQLAKPRGSQGAT